MNKHAKAWVEALRSGEYKQGTRVLANADEEEIKYCCLGVACDLYAKEHPRFKIERKKSFGPDVEHCLRYNGNDTWLPESVQKWLNLRSENGSFVGAGVDDVFPSLAYKNDDGWSFEQIAALIESQPEGLFGYGKDAAVV